MHTSAGMSFARASLSPVCVSESTTSLSVCLTMCENERVQKILFDAFRLRSFVESCIDYMRHAHTLELERFAAAIAANASVCVCVLVCSFAH